MDRFLRDKRGWTPLMFACIQGDADTVRTLLLDEWEDPDAQDHDGSTALIWACVHGRIDLVQLLLFRGADPNIFNCHGETSLIWATLQVRKIS